MMAAAQGYTKRCADCLESKHILDFYKNARNLDNLDHLCSACRRDRVNRARRFRAKHGYQRLVWGADNPKERAREIAETERQEEDAARRNEQAFAVLRAHREEIAGR